MKTNVFKYFIIGIISFTIIVSSCHNNETKKSDVENIDQNDVLSMWSDTIVKLRYEDGTIAEVWGYRPNDTLIHYEIKYYRNGEKWIEGTSYGDIRHGKWKAYDENGNLISLGSYKMGKGEGIKTVWHSNGQKYYEGYIEDGERIGVWEFFDENGLKVKEIDYSQLKPKQ